MNRMLRARLLHRKVRQSQTGMSLVEATIILMVLMLLTGVLAPSINDYVNDAKDVKVKEDCEAIGFTVMRLVRDIGPCLRFNANQDNWQQNFTRHCQKQNRVDILFSDGPDVTQNDLIGDASQSFNGNNNVANNQINWDDDDQRGDSMEHQFVTNDTGPRYPTPSTLNTYDRPGPHFNLGWRGAYLSSPIGPDPWGNRYLVNTVFLATARDANQGIGEGEMSGGWSHDVFCLSAGRNSLFETAFGGNQFGGTSRGGDDFIYVISGSSR